MGEFEFSFRFKHFGSQTTFSETTILNSDLQLSFRFTPQHSSLAQRFLQLCTFILIRLQNIHSNRRNDLNYNFQPILQPLLRITNEIIHENTLIINPEQDLSFNFVYFTTPNFEHHSQYTTFEPFLQQIHSLLSDLQNQSNNFLHFTFAIENILNKIDIAYCMVKFYTNYFLPLVDSPLPYDGQFNSRNFMYFILNLQQRPSFSLIKS